MVQQGRRHHHVGTRKLKLVGVEGRLLLLQVLLLLHELLLQKHLLLLLLLHHVEVHRLGAVMGRGLHALRRDVIAMALELTYLFVNAELLLGEGL